MSAEIFNLRKCGCESILIVEDDEFIRVLTKTFLEQFGFRVKEEGNGKNGFEAYKE